MDQNKDKEMYDNADKFIALANEMSKTVSHGEIGVAIRYAAAWYSTFEASMRTKNLAEDKDKHMEFFANTFTEMLQMNFEEYINLQSKVETKWCQESSTCSQFLQERYLSADFQNIVCKSGKTFVPISYGAETVKQNETFQVGALQVLGSNIVQ